MAELTEIPTLILRVWREIFLIMLFRTIYKMDCLSIFVCHVISVGSCYFEIHFNITFFIGKICDFFDTAMTSFGTDNIIIVFDTVAVFNHVETVISSVHKNNKFTYIKIFEHINSSLTLIRLRFRL